MSIVASKGLLLENLGSQRPSSASKVSRISYENTREIERFNDDIVNDLLVRTRQQLVVDDIDFTGGLSKSVRTGTEGSFRTLDIDSPYARFVEFGLPPGIRVNFDALQRWVAGKLGISDEKENRIVSSKIFQKILGKGIKPKRFLKKAIKSLIASRGVLRTRSITKNKVSRFQKVLNKGVKFAKKIKRKSKTLSKYIKTLGKVMKFGR